MRTHHQGAKELFFHKNKLIIQDILHICKWFLQKGDHSMNEVKTPAYWAVIPADVRYDEALPPNAKLLYGEISALTNEKGYCYAQNAFFSKVYGWSVATIQRLLNALADRGYIQVEIVRNKRTKEVEERRIYAGLQVGVTPPLKNERTSPQKKGDPPLKNDFPIKEEQYNTNNTPIPPKGARGVSMPKWKPEAFERWWGYYRKHGRGENRAGAVKAWDRLKPDDTLIQTMGNALMAQVKGEQWRRGVGIPYASTWLNNRRWEDDPLPAGQDAEDDGPLRVEDRGLPVWT